MKYLMLILPMFLIGCGSGYEVRADHYETCTQKESNILYRCVQIRALFFNNVILRQCDTLAECNEFCDNKQKGDE